MTDLATRPAEHELGTIERVIATGDLSRLTGDERARYYVKVCETLHLNPYTRPFEYLNLQGKLILYARKDATDQLRSLRRVSLTITARETVGDLYVVTARAQLPDGRTDEEIGAVPIKSLAGEALANAYMKASTKAKRRVTLSICGLGMLDETETGTIPGARAVTVEDAHAPPSRAPAIAAEIDRALAEADAVLAEPIDEHERERAPDPATGELPGPRWAGTPLGRQVSAMVDGLLAAGKTVELPASDADDATLRRWIDVNRRALQARQPAR